MAADAAGEHGASGKDATGGGAGAGEGGAVRLPPMVRSLGRRIVAAEVARLTAHEINNHLQGIIGLADLLEEEVGNPEWKASLAQIKLQGEKIAQLQRNLMTVIRGEEAGEALQPVDLGGLWQRVEPLVRGALTRRQAAVEIQVAGNLPAVMGDPDLLTQLCMLVVLWHLRSLDRRPAGAAGKLSFRLTLEAGAGRAVVWHSRDNGGGVPAVMKPAPSAELHPELYDDLTTFGLVQILETVNRHGGRLETQADEHSGLELKITIPGAGGAGGAGGQ